MKKLRILICSSGELGFNTIKNLSSHLNIVGILTDHSSTKIQDWAKDHQLPLFVGNPRNGKFYKEIEVLGQIDLLLSVNYLYLIEKDLITLPRLHAINIHGSKLPKYRGRAPHIWAIINGENGIGITIHKIDEGCDTGDILLQREIDLHEDITGGEVLKIFEIEYPVMILEAIESIKNGTARFQGQRHEEATYFEKRSPSDGEISWDWDSKRILNWTRALTLPYPGAFTFIQKNKIYVWKAEVAQMSVDMNDVNGKVIKVDGTSIFIKVSDGALKITNFTKSDNFEIRVGDIFSGQG